MYPLVRHITGSIIRSVAVPINYCNVITMANCVARRFVDGRYITSVSILRVVVFNNRPHSMTDMPVELSINTDSRLTVQDVTKEVGAAVPESADGTCTVFVPHTTAAVTVNEGERRLLSDFETALSDLVRDDGWKHDRIDDNADAHVRAMMIGPSVTVPVNDGDLDLGTWQSILFVECDGPRTRTLRVVE